MYKKILTSLLVIAAITISVWQSAVYFSHAEDVTATVEVRSSGSGGGGYDDPDPDADPDADPVSNPDPNNPVFISSITAHPERRAGSAGTNYDYPFGFAIFNSSFSQELYLHPNLLQLNSSGVYSVPIELSDIGAGIYDIVIKTDAHLAIILNNINLIEGDNHLNFTNETSAPENGSITLIAGDISGTGTVLESFGDNVINAIDLSVLLHQLGTADPTGANKANLNQDSIVDASDLNILLDNLDLIGDQ